MCCCGKPTINGEFGYKWQPDHAPITRQVDPPDMEESDVLLFDEPGRCGGLDSHCLHIRLVRRSSSVYLLVRHGAGDERIRLYPHKNLPDMFAAMDSNTRYWILSTIHSAHRHAEESGKQEERYKWNHAAAQKRIKTRKLPKSGAVKVWIEPEQQTA